MQKKRRPTSLDEAIEEMVYLSLVIGAGSLGRHDVAPAMMLK